MTRKLMLLWVFTHISKGTLRLSTNQPNADQPPFTTPTPTQDYPVCFEEVLEGVTWSNTSRKETDFKPCPYGKRGTASRKCSAEGIWNKANFTDCSSEDINKLNDAMEAIMKGEQSDLSAQQVLSWLAYASQPVKNNSLSTPEINKTELLIGVNILVKLAEYNNKNGNVSSTEDFQYFAQVASNLLESTNKRTWQELDKAGQGRSQFLVKAMEDYGLGVAATLNESTASRVVQRKNLKIRIDIVGENSPLRDRGLNVAYNQSSIYLPPPLFRSPQDTRVVTVIYLTLHEVLSLPREGKDESHQTASANTTIVSSTLSPRPQDVLSNPVKILLGNQKTHRKLRVPVNGKCVFWRPGEVARWSTSGCRLVRSESNASVTTCECDHLTIFAALMDPYGTSPPSKPLEIISIVGCSISLIAVVSTIFMYLISWKAIKRSGGRIGVKVLLQLCTALAVSCALVIFEGSARNKTWCLVVAVSLHYFLLALFSWMLCEGVLHYLVVVKMIPGDEAEDKFKYFCIFGWGFPAIVVAISLGVTHTNGYGDSVCWLDVKTGLIWAFIGPALLVICINIVVYVEVLRRMAGSPEAQRMRNRSKEMSRVKASIILLPLFGIAWLFGLMSFSSETILFKYLFAIFNSLQGLMIFVLHCARNKILRDALKQQLFKKCSKSHANRRLTPKTKAKQRDKPASSKAIKRSRNEDCEYELEPQTAESRSSAQILDTMLRQEDENSGNDRDDRDEHVQPLSDG